MCAFILFIYMNFAIDCSILGCLFLFGLATPKAGEIEWLYAWIATYYIFVLDLHMVIYLNGIDASNHCCKYWVSTCLKASKRTMLTIEDSSLVWHDKKMGRLLKIEVSISFYFSFDYDDFACQNTFNRCNIVLIV